MRKVMAFALLGCLVLAGCSSGEVDQNSLTDKYKENQAGADKLAKERGETRQPTEDQH